MAVMSALIVSLVIWIVLWAVGVKAFDSFLIVLLLFLLPAMAWQMAGPFVRRQLGRE